MRRWITVLAALISIGVGAGAQTAASETACEPVLYAGVEIVCFRSGVGSFTAEERARAVSARIERLARDRSLHPEDFTLVDREKAVEILAGETVLLSFGEEDSENGPARREMAVGAVFRLRSALAEHRSATGPGEILWGIGYSVLATLGLVLVLATMARVFPRLYSRIREVGESRLPPLRIQSFELLSREKIVVGGLAAARAVRLLITLFALYIYVPLVLSFFPRTADLAPTLFGYVTRPLFRALQVFVEFIPNFFFLATIVILTRYVLKIVRFFFREIEAGRIEFEGFHQEWADPTFKLVRILILAFALVMAFPYLPGSGSPAFQGISVFLGILLSLGSSSAVANIVSGVVLTYMRPFRVGDRVKIADTVGDVVEKTLLVTRVRSIKNVDVTIPNSMVLGSHIVNYSSSALSTGLVLNTTMTIGYDVPWRTVHDLLKEAARRTPRILPEPAPYVFQTALNDFHVSYELNATTDRPNQMVSIFSDLHANIQDCFAEAGIEIMSPNYHAVRDGNESTLPAVSEKTHSVT